MAFYGIVFTTLLPLPLNGRKGFLRVSQLQKSHADAGVVLTLHKVNGLSPVFAVQQNMKIK